MTVIPEDADNQEAAFASSDEHIAVIEGDVLFAVSEGTVTVTARQEDKDFGAFTLDITPVLPDRIIFHAETIALGIGRSAELAADVSPKNTTDKLLTYTSSDPAVAAVDGSRLTAVSAGTAVVTARHKTGLTAECVVTVTPVLPEKIEIQGASSIIVGSSAALSVVFFPEDVTDKSVLWSSSDSAVLSVDNGKITGRKTGVATITATHPSGVSASKRITVSEVLATGVFITGSNKHTIYTKEKLELSADILPANTTNKTVTWSSDDPSVASVKNGVVTGISPGYTSIRVKTSNGKFDTFAITVKASSVKMRVSIETTDIGIDSVGGDWWGSFRINGTSVSDGDWGTLELDDYLTISTNIYEDVYYLVSDSETSYHTVTGMDLELGFSEIQWVTFKVYDGLMYHTVMWHITYDFSTY